MPITLFGVTSPPERTTGATGEAGETAATAIENEEPEAADVTSESLELSRQPPCAESSQTVSSRGMVQFFHSTPLLLVFGAAIGENE